MDIPVNVAILFILALAVLFVQSVGFLTYDLFVHDTGSTAVSTFVHPHKAVSQSQNAPASDSGTINDATTGAIADTSGWQTYRNEQYGFEVKYPSIWRTVSCDNKDSFFLFLAPSDEALGKCASDFGGQMDIFVERGNQTSQSGLSVEDYTNIIRDEIRINWIEGIRMSGIGITEDGPVLPGDKGDKDVVYTFYKNEKTYTIRYTQAISGILSEDVLPDFDFMVRKTFKLFP